MTELSVTADTNILASGFARLRTNPGAAPVQFVQAWLDDRFALVQSEALHAELARTLTKRYFAQRLSEADRTAIRQLVEHKARLTALIVSVAGIATHPEDDLVLATALSGSAQFVVTGDHRLLNVKVYRGPVIVGVHEFLATLPGLQT